MSSGWILTEGHRGGPCRYPRPNGSGGDYCVDGCVFLCSCGTLWEKISGEWFNRGQRFDLLLAHRRRVMS